MFILVFSIFGCSIGCPTDRQESFPEDAYWVQWGFLEQVPWRNVHFSDSSAELGVWVWRYLWYVSLNNRELDSYFIVWMRSPHMEAVNMWYMYVVNHYDDVLMSSMAYQITSLTVIYPTVYSGTFIENIKAARHWPLCGEFTGDRWIPRTNGQ